MCKFTGRPLLVTSAVVALALSPLACRDQSSDQSSTEPERAETEATPSAPAALEPPSDQTQIIPMTIQDAADVDAIDIVRQRLDEGVSPDAGDENGSTALHQAARRGHLAIAELLIDRGADVNAQNNSGATPLHWATRGNRLPVVKLLIEHGASPSIRDSRNMTALEYAVVNQDEEIIAYLESLSESGPAAP